MVARRKCTASVSGDRRASGGARIFGGSRVSKAAGIICRKSAELDSGTESFRLVHAERRGAEQSSLYVFRFLAVHERGGRDFEWNHQRVPRRERYRLPADVSRNRCRQRLAVGRAVATARSVVFAGGSQWKTVRQ